MPMKTGEPQVTSNLFWAIHRHSHILRDGGSHWDHDIMLAGALLIITKAETAIC